jgi:sugar lactone lactonase YvrE
MIDCVSSLSPLRCQFTPLPSIFRSLCRIPWQPVLALTALIALLALTPVQAQTVTFNGQGTIVSATGLNYADGVAVDGAGDVYIADTSNNRVVEVTAAGVTSTLNTGSLAGPTGVAVDGAGDVYIADTSNNRVVEVTAAGAASVLSTGSLAPVPYGCGSALCEPFGVAVDSAGDVYIADFGDNRVVEVTAAGAASVLNVGSLILAEPTGVAVDGAGNVYIADFGNNRVVEVTAAGAASVLNTGSLILAEPTGVAVDGAGNVYIADFKNNRIVEVTAAGAASVLNTGSLARAPYGCGSTVCEPFGVAVDGVGDVYIADYGDNRVVEVSQSVNFGTVAVGSTATANQQTLTYTFQSNDTLTAVNVLTQGTSGKDYTADASSTCKANTAFSATGACTVVVDLSPTAPGVRMGAVQLVDANGVQATTYLRAVGDGPLGIFQPGTASLLNAGSLAAPTGVAVDGAGNVYIVDADNSRIVEVTAAGASSVLSFSGLSGNYNCGSTGLCTPFGIAVDGAGDVYIGDTYNNRIVEVTAAGVASVLNTGSLAAPTGSPCTATALCQPTGVAVDGAGNVYIADTGNNRAVKVTAAGVASVLSTGSLTVSSCTTPANTTVTTVLCTPYGIGVDGAGDVYIADSYNNRVVEVTAAGAASVLNTGSLILSEPTDMKVDSAGDIYIADYGNDRVVEVTATGAASVLNASSLPGTTGGETIYSCATTGLCRPAGVALDGAGNLYIADTYNNRAAELATGLALSFAKTIVGQTSTDSPQTVTFENIGNEPMNITALATGTTGQTSSSFNLNGSGTTCTSTTSLTSSESCVLGVEFSPLLFGPLTGTVSITDNSLNGTGTVQQIGLSGTGLVVNSIAITPVSPQIIVGGTQQFAATATFSDNSTQDVTTAATWNSSNTSVATIDTSALASASHPGSANITAAWETITSNSDTLTVSQATPTITWATPAAITYGAALSSTQLDASLSVAGSCAYTPAVGAVLAAGTQTLSVTCTPTDTTDYSSSTTTVQITVTPAVLTVTAANASRAYGAANPTFTDTIIGYVNGDTSSVVTGAASLTTTATTASPAGTYPITAAAGTLAASNYTFTFVNGALTITQTGANLTWTTPAAITYGAALSAAQLDATSGGVAGVFAYTPAAGTVLTAGPHTLSVTFTPTDTADYSSSTTTVQITVTPAVLTVTAANASRAYGAANPTFTDTIAGYVNGDTSSVVTGAASLTTTATTASAAGTYPITAAAGTLAASNYTFAFVNGALTIGQAAPTISWSPVSSITYGTTLNGILNATAQFGGSAVTGTFSYTATLAGGSPVAVTSATVLGTGSYTLTATFAPTGTTAGDYQAVSSSVPLSVNLAQLTVTLTSNFNPVLVQNAITFTATVSSTAGVPTGTVTFLDGATPLGTGTVSGGLATFTTSALTVGLHSITASYGGDANLAGATSSPLTESVEDFSMNASGATATALPGSTAEFTFALSPIGGTTLPAAITFTVSGLPAGATYSLSPATLAAGAGTTTVTVTVNLPQTTAAAHSTGSLGRKATPFLLALLLLPFAGRLRRTGKRLSSTLPMLLLLGLSLAAAVGLSGCGSTSNFFAHSQKSYTVTVTGTSGALSHSTTVTLTVE